MNRDFLILKAKDYRARTILSRLELQYATVDLIGLTKRRMAHEMIDKLMEEKTDRFDLSILFGVDKADEPESMPKEYRDTVVSMEVQIKRHGY